MLKILYTSIALIACAAAAPASAREAARWRGTPEGFGLLQAVMG